MELSPEHAAALDKSITPPRMGTYRNLADGDPSLARELYLWDRELALAFWGDIAIIEVALRNAMSEQLEARWGAEWFAHLDLSLDDRPAAELHRAWTRVTGEKNAGKLVAQCMFGFWRGLLDKGGHAGKDPRRVRCNYETLWPGVLDKSFPGGRMLATMGGPAVEPGVRTGGREPSQ